MNTTALTHLSISYVETDVPESHTLLQWRRELDAARREQQPPRRRPLRRRRLRPARSTP